MGLRRREPAVAVAPAGDGRDEHFATVAAVLERAAGGDLEVRVPPLVGASPELVEMRHQLNRVLDVVDAVVREAQVSLTAAAEGRFHRRFLTRGLPGTYRVAAERIGRAHQRMRASAEQLESEGRTRGEIVGHAVEVSTHVAAASTELSASAGALAASTRAGVGEIDGALSTVRELDETAASIGEMVKLITGVAATTRLLALNATIEAARAGVAGRGFSVVAGEVKRLADDTAGSSRAISRQVEASQVAAQEAARAMARLAEVVQAIDREVDGIVVAAGDGHGGLARLAEELRVHVTRFAS